MLTTRSPNNKMYFTFFFALVISLKGLATNDFYFYIVKETDIASSILYRSGLKPIYKKNGFLRRLKKINPKIVDLDQIYPGQKLTFSAELVKKGKSLGLIGVTTENEIYFVVPNLNKKSNVSPLKIDKIPENLVLPPTPETRVTKIQKSKTSNTKIEQERRFKSNIALGAGFTFLSFEQNGSETRNLKYSSLMGPSFSLRGRVEWINGYGIEASYANYPGQLNSSANSIINNRFSWITQSLEITYRVNKKNQNKSFYHLLTGIQHHNLPYVQLPTASTADVRKHEMYLATLGIDYNLELSKKWRSQILLRYQIPFSQSKSIDDIQFQNRFSFDGSLGTMYFLNNQFNLGLFWYGQWHEFNYSMLSEATEQKDIGTNKFIFSNMELRIGYEF